MIPIIPDLSKLCTGREMRIFENWAQKTHGCICKHWGYRMREYGSELIRSEFPLTLTVRVGVRQAIVYVFSQLFTVAPPYHRLLAMPQVTYAWSLQRRREAVYFGLYRRKQRFLLINRK